MKLLKDKRLKKTKSKCYLLKPNFSNFTFLEENLSKPQAGIFVINFDFTDIPYKIVMQMRKTIKSQKFQMNENQNNHLP